MVYWPCFRLQWWLLNNEHNNFHDPVLLHKIFKLCLLSSLLFIERLLVAEITHCVFNTIQSEQRNCVWLSVFVWVCTYIHTERTHIETVVLNTVLTASPGRFVGLPWGEAGGEGDVRRSRCDREVYRYSFPRPFPSDCVFSPASNNWQTIDYRFCS